MFTGRRGDWFRSYHCGLDPRAALSRIFCPENGSDASRRRFRGGALGSGPPPLQNALYAFLRGRNARV
jgi:hypothetical protein